MHYQKQIIMKNYKIFQIECKIPFCQKYNQIPNQNIFQIKTKKISLSSQKQTITSQEKFLLPDITYFNFQIIIYLKSINQISYLSLNFIQKQNIHSINVVEKVYKILQNIFARIRGKTLFLFKLIKILTNQINVATIQNKLVYSSQSQISKLLNVFKNQTSKQNLKRFQIVRYLNQTYYHHENKVKSVSVIYSHQPQLIITEYSNKLSKFQPAIIRKFMDQKTISLGSWATKQLQPCSKNLQWLIMANGSRQQTTESDFSLFLLYERLYERTIETSESFTIIKLARKYADLIYFISSTNSHNNLLKTFGIKINLPPTLCLKDELDISDLLGKNIQTQTQNTQRLSKKQYK